MWVSLWTDLLFPLAQEQLSEGLACVASLLVRARALQEETRKHLCSIVSRTRSFYDSVLSSYDPTVRLTHTHAHTVSPSHVSLPLLLFPSSLSLSF